MARQRKAEQKSKQRKKTKPSKGSKMSSGDGHSRSQGRGSADKARSSQGAPASSGRSTKSGAPGGTVVERSMARTAVAPRRPILEDEIRARAYEIFLRRGNTPGDSVADWLQAERELREEYSRRIGV